MNQLDECLRQLSVTAAFLRTLGGRHERFAAIWADHLEGDAKSLQLLAEVLEDDVIGVPR